MYMKPKLLIFVMFLLLLSSFGFADFTEDNQAWVSLQDGNESSFDLYGGVTGAEGVVNGAFDFTNTAPGTDEYIQAPESYDYSIRNYSFKFKSTSTETYDIMFGTRSSGSGITVWNRYATSGIRVLLENTAGTEFTTSTYAGYNDGNWHNFSLEVNEGVNYKLYLDGILKETVAISGTLTDQAPLVIGTDASSLYLYDGLIDEFKVSGDGSQVFYASMDSLYDQSNNSNSFSGYNGVTYDATEDAYDFDGTDDYVISNSFNQLSNTATISAWINLDTLSSNQFFFSQGYNPSEIGRVIGYITTAGKLAFGKNGGGTSVLSSGSIGTNSWHMVTISRNDSNASVYIDGTFEGSENDWTGNTANDPLIVGAISETSDYTDGSISNYVIYNRTLSSTEVSDLYAEGRTYSPYATLIQNFTISARDSATLNNIQIFNATVNGNFYNTTSGLITLPYLLNESEILNITVEASNYVTYTNESYNASNPLVADLDPETLQDFSLITPNNTKTNESYYNVTYTEAVSPTSKTVTYNISVYNPNGTLKESFETTNLIYELNLTDYNANIYNITVNAEESDTGTNYTHSSNLYVDRTNYVYFKDANNDNPLVSNAVTLTLPNGTQEDYTTDGEGKINYQSFRGFNFINGTTNITYDDDKGYVTPITFTYEANTLPYNLTYNISRANLNITVKDGSNNQLITENITIAVTGIGSFTTSNGTLFLENQSFVSGEYTVYVSSENYTYNQKTFTYTNQEQLSLTIYVLPLNYANVGNIYVNVYDSYLDVIAGADLRLQELDVLTSSFKEVSQRISSSGGQSVFQVLLNEKTYRIYGSVTINGVTYDSYSTTRGEIFYADGQTINIYLDTVSDVIEKEYEGLDITVTNTDLVNNVSFHEVTYFDENGLDHTVCLEYSYKNGLIKTSSEIICDTSSSGTINYDSGFLLDRDYTWMVDVYVKEGDYKRYYYTETYDKSNSFSDIFSFIIKALIGALLLLSLGLALYLERIDYFIYLAIFWFVLWSTIARSYVSLQFLGLSIVMSYFVLTMAKKKNNAEEE